MAFGMEFETADGVKLSAGGPLSLPDAMRYALSVSDGIKRVRSDEIVGLIYVRPHVIVEVAARGGPVRFVR